MLTSLEDARERKKKKKREKSEHPKTLLCLFSAVSVVVFLNFSFLFIFFYETSTIYSKRTRVVWYDYILDDSTLLTLLLMSQSTRISSRV